MDGTAKAKMLATELGRTLLAIGIASGAATIRARRSAILDAADAITINIGQQAVAIATEAINDANLGWPENDFKSRIVNGVDQIAQNLVTTMETKYPTWFDAGIAYAQNLATKLIG